MSSDEKKQSGEFNLKELRDIASSSVRDRSSKKAVQQDKPAQKATIRSFVDNADDLLADIRNTVDEEVVGERSRFQAQREEARQTAYDEAQEIASRKSLEIQARIEAEEKRRQAAADERKQLRETMEREARHARGDITDEPVEISAPASLTTEPVRPAEPKQESRGTGVYIAVLGTGLVGLIVLAVLMLQPTTPTNGTDAAGENTAQKVSVASPIAPPVATPPAVVAPQIDAGVIDASVPDATVVDAQVPDASIKKKKKKKRKRRSRKRSSKKKKKTIKKRKNAEKKKGGINFGDGGKITF